MPIAEYLNNQGRFMLLTLPGFHRTVKLARGTFYCVPFVVRKRLRNHRMKYWRVVNTTALPTPVFSRLYYVPNENIEYFQRRVFSLDKRTKKLLSDVKANWDTMTAESRSGVKDVLRARWQNSGSDRTMTYAEFIRQSMRDYDRQTCSGHLPIETRFSYVRLDSISTSQPRGPAYRSAKATLWHWMMRAEAEVSERIEKGLDWLAGRSSLYEAVTDRLYYSRKYMGDWKGIPLNRYCVWLRLFGRTEAAKVLTKLNTSLQSFYDAHKGGRGEAGAGVARKAGIKSFTKAAKTKTRFLEAMESPLNVDALVANG